MDKRRERSEKPKPQGGRHALEELRARLMHLMSEPGYAPVNETALAEKLGLPPAEHIHLRDLLDRMETGRDIVRLRPDRFALREAITLVRPAEPEAPARALAPALAPALEKRVVSKKPVAPARPDFDLEIAERYKLRVPFPEQALEEAERIPALREEQYRGRDDCRDAFTFTIDPDDARDFDDAIAVETLPGGGWQLSVHIADVSYYVRPGTALDREAFKRGNSVYLASRVLPMLPERLSNDLCSLRPDEDRLTMYARINFDRHGHERSVSFGRAVIRSRHRLTYKAAFAILQGKTAGGAVGKHLQAAAELAGLLRRNRMTNGALDLDFPEVKVRLDQDRVPIAIELVEQDIAHQLIEEFMLAANEAVAREIRNKLVPSVYRVHEDPDPDKLSEFRELAGLHGIRCGDLTNRRELTRTMDAIRKHPSERILKYALLRSLKRAAYDPRPLGHFGLSKSNYTHFTSPIRRYADLLVHRKLEQATGMRVAVGAGKRKGKSVKGVHQDLGYVSEHISETERVAAEAERESVHLMKLQYLQQQLIATKPEVFPGVIVEVLRMGVLVEIPRLLVTGLVHVSALRDDFYQYDPGRHQLAATRSRRTYGIGDRMDVLIARIDMARQQVDFYPA